MLPAADADRATIESLISQRDGEPPARLRLRRHVLRGELEATSLDRIVAHYLDSAGDPHTFSLVVKRLDGPTAREASVYERFVAQHAADLAPTVYNVVQISPQQSVLYLEALEPVSSWPWSDRQAAQSALVTAASLHTRVLTASSVEAVSEWDYESELQHKATLTLQSLERLRRQSGLWTFGGGLRWTRRIVDSLPTLRRQLLEFAPFGTSVIHGDLHSGNVILRNADGETAPVLIDWARTRMGSPLEDVSSWLQSLGAWEPEARRRHDTLFAGYLASRGMEPRLNADTRAAYWLAGASNALAGSLLYYIAVLMDPIVPSTGRASAANLVREWVRVLRRADAFWS